MRSRLAITMALASAIALAAWPAFADNFISSGVTPSWAGATSLTTLGTIITGTWNGTTIGVGYGGTGVTAFGGANTLLYTTTANNLASLTTANSSVLTTGVTGIPAWGTDLPTAITIGTAYVYRVGGTDVAVADGGTGASTLTSNGALYGNGAGAVQSTAQGGTNTVLVANAGAPSFSNSPTIAKLTTSNASLNTDGDELIDMSGTVGTSAASAKARGINLSVTNNPSTNANTAFGLDLTVANQSALSNTVYGAAINLTNAATPASGTTTFYGLQATASLTDLPANVENGKAYGIYSVVNLTAQATASGTYDNYGIYVANGTSNTNGTSTKYGLYLESLIGADTNLGIVLAGANPVLLNATSAYGTNSELLEVNVSSGLGGAALSNWSSTGTSTAAILNFKKSKSGTIGSHTLGTPASGDFLGIINGQGSDATDFENAARISFVADGTWGANDSPGRIEFSTTPDGSNNLSERMRITSGGNLLINGTTSYGQLGQRFEINTSDNYGGAAFNTWSATAAQGPTLDFNRSKSATIGTQSAVAAADLLGLIQFRGSTGSAFLTGSYVAGFADGTWSGTSVPSYLSFATTPSGSNSNVERMRIEASGNIFMYDLETSGVNQNGYLCLSTTEEVINDSTTCLASSRRYKERIRLMSGDMGLKTVLALSPVTFDWKKTGRPESDTDPNRTGRQMGFIAEEAQKVDPRLITVEKNQKQARSFRYESYTAVLTKAIQEQQQQIDMLMQHNNYLESEIERLKQRQSAEPKAKASWLWPWQAQKAS